MLNEYWPVFIFIVISVGLGIALLVIGGLLGPNRPTEDKLSAYECGFEAFDDARMQFDVRFYLVAILFIVFDLEIAFFVPWAVVMENVGLTAFAAVIVFTIELAIGLAYLWKKGALEWE